MSLSNYFNISNKTGASNDYSNGNDYQTEIPSYIGYLINGFIFIIISFNLPSIFVLFFTRVEQSNFISIHILSLSLTDCGVGISLFFFVSLPTVNYWDCLARFSFFGSMYFSSMTQVAVICLDRVLMFHNLRWKSVTKNAALVSKIVVATFLITLSLTVIQTAVFTTPHDTSKCGIEVVFVDNVNVVRLYIATGFICVECCIISCTAAIIRFLWKRKYSKRVNPLTSIPVQNHMDKETQAIFTLLIIVGVYIILTTPLNILTLVSGITGKSPGRTAGASVAALGCLNSVCNPIVYSFRIPEMKQAFKTTWNKIRCR